MDQLLKAQIIRLKQLNGIYIRQYSNLVFHNLIDIIKRFILFINSYSERWKQLEKPFSLTNISRKYKLTIKLYALKYTHTHTQ